MFRPLAIVGTLMLGSSALLAGSIDFEIGAGRCAFSGSPSTALTTEYAGSGVTFSGPSAIDGGATVDQCGNWGINAHSGTAFLAFNAFAVSSLAGGGAPIGPETLTFSSLVTDVSIWASVGRDITLTAFDGSGKQVGSSSVANAAGSWNLLQVSAPGIATAVLSYSGPVAIFDDLNFTPGGTAVPEPGTLGFLVVGLGVVTAGWIRRNR
ncbi:MAG: PEP-CTERM sorting domain-containing protein [Acidobacteria bacterium]|nr:PEP-CTERM sorting domain-containing protein [Acidobacteriota bacterium]